jgi:hypothetical protein
MAAGMRSTAKALEAASDLWNPDGAAWLSMQLDGTWRRIMPDRPRPTDTREARSRLSDNYVVIGIVAVCVLIALALLWAGMIDTGEKSTTQPSTQAPATTQPETQAPATTQPETQAPATTQPETQAPGAGENKTP